MGADAPDAESSVAFIELLREFMQRVPAAQHLPVASFAQGCCTLEQHSSGAWQAAVQHRTNQAAGSELALQGCLPDMIDSAVMCALQASFCLEYACRLSASFLKG